MLTFKGKFDPNKPIDHTGCIYEVVSRGPAGWTFKTWLLNEDGSIAGLSGGSMTVDKDGNMRCGFDTEADVIAYLRKIGADDAQIHAPSIPNK